jgi:hypothetical protein
VTEVPVSDNGASPAANNSRQRLSKKEAKISSINQGDSEPANQSSQGKGGRKHQQRQFQKQDGGTSQTQPTQDNGGKKNKTTAEGTPTPTPR